MWEEQVINIFPSDVKFGYDDIFTCLCSFVFILGTENMILKVFDPFCVSCNWIHVYFCDSNDEALLD